MDNIFKSIIKKPARNSGRSGTSRTGDTLHHLAFDNAAQANIITLVSNGKIIMANCAATKLLGYSKKELLTKSRSVVFNINEDSFKTMLKQRTAEGQSKATVTAIKKSGKVFICEITSAVFMDEHGNENAITTITDISENIILQKNIDTKKEKIIAGDIIIAKSKQKYIDIIRKEKVAADIDLARSKQKKVDIKKDKVTADNIVLAKAKSDARLSENNEWIKYIAKASYDVMWDWDIASGEIYVGDSIKEVFGYSLQNNTMNFTDFCNCLLPEEKDRVESKILKALTSESKVWDDSFMFERRDGSVASTNSRASIVRDSAGKALHMIGAIEDVSQLAELEKMIAEQALVHKEDSEKFLLAAKLSFDVIWDWNLLTNEVFLGDGFEELFGYRIKNNKANMITDWVNILYADDKETVVKELQACIKSPLTHWEHAYRVSRADGSIAKVYVRASIIRHADGKAYRMIGAMQDLSRQKELEESLEQEIRLREKQITEATADAKEAERSQIGKELHDNINQLLGASIMYVQMAKRGGKNSAMYLSRSSEYTLNAIDEIRKLTKGLTTDIINNLGLGEAIENVARDMMEVNAVKISCVLNSFKEANLNDKFKHNVFRIVQEQLNNILKHAGAKKIIISLSQNKKAVKLTMSDNGVGFDTIKKQKGIGIENIKGRASAYGGKADFVSEPGQGCVLTVVFPVSNLV
ncbi:MAG: PAS domain-containing protein, partial [Ferruginibacter sp.]